MPTRDRTISQRGLTIGQCNKRLGMVSSAQPHKKHLFGRCHPLLCSLSKVRTLPLAASQAKKETLVGTKDTQMPLTGNKEARPDCDTLEASRTEKREPVSPLQETVSRSVEYQPRMVDIAKLDSNVDGGKI